MLNRFADVTRGGQLESCHAGALVIATAAGDILGVAGANGKEVFPRSSIKLIQALPLIETGAADRYTMGDAELALACASHVGSPRHIAIVSQLLERAGLAAGKLACGPQFPLDIDDQRALLKSGLQATALHNNCSGKHAAMLLTARHLGEPIEHYELAQHPVQERIRQTIEEVVGARLDDAIPGIDGCSVPTWRLASSPISRPSSRQAITLSAPAPKSRASDGSRTGFLSVIRPGARSTAARILPALSMACCSGPLASSRPLPSNVMIPPGPVAACAGTAAAPAARPAAGKASRLRRSIVQSMAWFRATYVPRA